ncbi:MAG: site-2 protease family protein [Acidobacteriaceae bacterium]
MSQQEFVLVLFQVVVLVLAFSVHESAHAYTAMRLGDPTAYMLGRVTLNPMKHLDPLGSVLVPLISLVYGGMLIGWAKPCPVTTRNFRHIKRDDILVSMAGPASNLAMATVALVLLVIFKHLVAGGVPSIEAAMLMARHVAVETDNLPTLFPIALLLYYGVFINLLLFVFNLIPIPPLDGSHVLRQFLPYQVEQVYNRIGMWGLIIIFLFGGGLIFGTFFYPLLRVFNQVLTSM